MTKNRILILSGITLVFFLMVYSLLAPQEDSAYRLELEKVRSEKNRMFRNSNMSPLTQETLKTFMGLSYYPVDTEFRVVADLTWLTVPDTLLMPVTEGPADTMIWMGYADFTCKGQQHRLKFYKNPYMTDEKIFVPFKDKTSGIETYGGGRYLDAKTENNVAIFDFNTAYFPFCAYNDDWVCLLTPPENTLSIEIKAGENMKSVQ